jgi:hypothetical protein
MPVPFAAKATHRVTTGLLSLWSLSTTYSFKVAASSGQMCQPYLNKCQNGFS